MNLMEKLAPGPSVPDDFIPLIVPEICGNEWKYVKECLDTSWVSSVGSYVERFEKMVAERVVVAWGTRAASVSTGIRLSLLAVVE